MRKLESLASDSATLQAYLQEIAQFPPVSGDEERDLAERIKSARDYAALSRLVGAHLHGVVRYARRYRALGVRLLDLIHDGNLALIDAARRFEPSRHGPFTSYAAWWVRQGIMHRLAGANGEGAGGPLDLDPGRHVEALQAALEHSLAPGDNETVDFSEDEVRRLDEPASRLTHTRDTLDVEEFVDSAVIVEDDVAEDEVRGVLVAELEAAMRELDPSERRALELSLGLRDGEPRNLAQVGQTLGVSRRRAERLAAEAVRKLRRQRWIRSSLN